MALHRDIYWIGRQWAVTGYGIQAVDQRLKGAFDIERTRLGEAGLIAHLRQSPRFNEPDFAKAFTAACGRFSIAPDNPTALALEQSAASQAPPATPSASQEIRLRLGPQPTPARFLPQWWVRR